MNSKAERRGRTLAFDGTARAGSEPTSTNYGSSPKEQWQAGARLDLDSGPTRAWAALGVQGLAPYFFNFAPTVYVRDGGRVAGRIQGSYDLYLSQRLILQPQVEMNFYSQVDRGRGIGTGLSDLDSGVRLGYQISRKFAPYIGFTYSSSFGQTAPFAHSAGESVHVSSLVFGVWIWR